MLENIKRSDDLRNLNDQELNQLTDDIRRELINTVSKNGGHLASNLGIVELTVALHRVFHTPQDKIIFDVGHQCYVHKMLTGRAEDFHTLRTYHGISGFPKRSESESDCFETGHASTAISAALGYARARDAQHESYDVVAVVGDGALTGGMCYEALNDAGNTQTRMIVVLNDNEMSIAPNVGALSSYLTELRISSGWQGAKQRIRHLKKLSVPGKAVYRLIHNIKSVAKSLLFRNESIGFFEALGFQYFGPIDGHDLKSLEKTLKNAKEYQGPCVIHVLTKKGAGYEQAEEKPEKFHGTPPFYIETGARIDTAKNPSCGHLMADTLAEMTEKEPRILAITAAMKLGTGLDHYEEKYPDHVYDVGITEEHAVTMAAGLAAGGMKPYFAVYASFFQRCYDQLIHDVCMQNLKVTFLLDRSGIGGEDGQTHHGIFDFAEILPIPNLTVLAPCDGEELRQMLWWTLDSEGPCVIRYGKSIGTDVDLTKEDFRPGKWSQIGDGKDAAVFAVGSMVGNALKIRDMLKKDGISITVVNCSSVKPYDADTLRQLIQQMPCFILEEHMRTGGFGSYITKICLDCGWPVPAACFAIPDCFIAHGKHQLLIEDAGLDPETVSEKITRILKEHQQ